MYLEIDNEDNIGFNAPSMEEKAKLLGDNKSIEQQNFPMPQILPSSSPDWVQTWVLQAMQFAFKKHHGQARKDGSPMIAHVLRVREN